MGDDEHWQRFERLAMPHLDAAYNLAVWLTRNGDDAQDVVQEAVIRGMRTIDGLRPESARPWLLQLVRHTCHAWLRANRPSQQVLLGHPDDVWPDLPAPSTNEPPAVAIRKADRARIDDAITALPIAYREVFVLRELQELSYSDIAHIAEIPVGTVMSRLSRARGLMRTALAPTARPALHPVPRASRSQR